MAAILCAALALQFWQLSYIPPGLDDDSAANGWSGIQWLRAGPLPFWNLHSSAAEPLMVWLQTGSTWLFGPSVFALRAISALAIALAAPLSYLLAWETGRTFTGERSPQAAYIARWGARFAGILVAVGPVFLEVGRTGLRATLLPLAIGLLLLALLYAVRIDRAQLQLRYFVLGGLLLGLALYTYLAARFLPLLVGLFLLFRLVQDFNQPAARRRYLLGCALLVGSALMVALPQLLFFLHAPDAFWMRAGAVTLAQNPLAQELSYAEVLLYKIAAMARMLGIEWWGQYNQAERPLLQPLAFVGLLAGLWPLARVLRAPGPQLMALTAAIMLLPELVGGDRAQPHTLRLIGSLLPIVTLSGLGLAWLSHTILTRLPRIRIETDSRLATGMGLCLACWLFAWGTIDWIVFIEPRLSRSEFSWYAREDVALAQWINRQEEPLLVPLYELSRPTIAYLTAARAGHPAGGLPAPSARTDVRTDVAYPATAWLIEPADPTRTRVESTSYRYDPTTLVLLDQGRAWLLPPLQTESLNHALTSCPQWVAIVEENPRVARQVVGGRACRVDFAALNFDTGDFAARDQPTPSAGSVQQTATRPDAHATTDDHETEEPPGYLFHNDLHLLWAEADTREIGGRTRLGINTFWRAPHANNRSWRVYVHLLDDHQTRIAGEDFMPAYGFFGTEMWGISTPGMVEAHPRAGGSVIPLRQLLTLPETLPPGRYWIAAGLYDPLTLERSPVREYNTGTPVEQARFGPLKVSLPPATPWPASRPASIRLGDTLLITAYTVEHAPDQVTVRLQLEARASPRQDYTFFLHVVGPEGDIIAQHDAQPLDGAYPTGIWDAGEVVLTELTAILPPDMIESDMAEDQQRVEAQTQENPAANYTLWLGAYDWQSGERLPVFIDDVPDRPHAVQATDVQTTMETDTDRVRLP